MEAAEDKAKPATPAPQQKRKGRGRPKLSASTQDTAAKLSTLDGVLSATDMPEEAKIVAKILKSMGIDDCEPNVLPQFLEFMHRYITDVLQDALVYSEHSGKGVLDLEDVRLAIQSRVNYSFTSPPPREVMLELAQRKNNIPLPFIPRYYDN